MFRPGYGLRTQHPSFTSSLLEGRRVSDLKPPGQQEVGDSWREPQPCHLLLPQGQRLASAKLPGLGGAGRAGLCVST